MATTGRSSGAAKSGRARALRPARRLGLSVRFIGGESNGSYVRRLAGRNGIPVNEFWPMLGAPGRPGGEPADPRYSDGYLNTAALERLAVMSHRPVEQLQFALPNLCDHRLLPVGGGPAWDWPWDTPGCFLVRVCELCARIKGTALDAYLAADTPWQVCVRHARWLDNRREPGTAAIRLTRLPDVIDAHRNRLRLERHLGAGGRALFADAYAITSYWWNHPGLNSPRWHARRHLLGQAGVDELRVAPLLFYPETAHLAQAMAARERRRLRRTLSRAEDGQWLTRTAQLLKSWGIPKQGLDPVVAWLVEHPLLPRPRHATPAAARPAHGRNRPLPLATPHTAATMDTPLGDRSCLPWKLGELITTQLHPAPGGWTLNGRA